VGLTGSETAWINRRPVFISGQVVKKVKALEREIYPHARNLEFQEAGRDPVGGKYALGRPEISGALTRRGSLPSGE